jgi:hypothetical protein
MSHYFYITPEEYEKAAEVGVSAFHLERRIRTFGWCKARAVNTPPRKLTNRKKWAKIAEKNGICYSTFTNRINNYGWDEEKAATEPPQDRKEAQRRATDKIRKIPREWVELAATNGIAYHTLYRRLKRGLSVEEATRNPVMTHKEIGQMRHEIMRKRYGDFNRVK